MGMTDSQFKAYLRKVRTLLKKAIEDEATNDKEKIKSNIEEICNQITEDIEN
jgi:ribosomal protein S20